jgi:hypothetical protein
MRVSSSLGVSHIEHQRTQLAEHEGLGMSAFGAWRKSDEPHAEKSIPAVWSLSVPATPRASVPPRRKLRCPLRHAPARVVLRRPGFETGQEHARRTDTMRHLCRMYLACVINTVRGEDVKPNLSLDEIAFTYAPEAAQSLQQHCWVNCS